MVAWGLQTKQMTPPHLTIGSIHSINQFIANPLNATSERVSTFERVYCQNGEYFIPIALTPDLLFASFQFSLRVSPTWPKVMPASCSACFHLMFACPGLPHASGMLIPGAASPIDDCGHIN